MFKETMEKALNFYESYDYLMIVNKDGIAEYSTTYCYEKKYSANDAFVNKKVYHPANQIVYHL